MEKKSGRREIRRQEGDVTVGLFAQILDLLWQWQRHVNVCSGWRNCRSVYGRTISDPIQKRCLPHNCSLRQGEIFQSSMQLDQAKAGVSTEYFPFDELSRNLKRQVYSPEQPRGSIAVALHIQRVVRRLRNGLHSSKMLLR